MNEDFLSDKLLQRKASGAIRQLKTDRLAVDFCSNDYLGIVKHQLLNIPSNYSHGSTGSRLISGNDANIEILEKKITAFHHAPAGLLFNSGYDANLGLLSCVPQKGDTILYDELSHASIRDGIRLSFARSFSFRHNDIEDLGKKLSLATGNIFVITEAVFSMDGDTAPLKEIVALTDKYNGKLIVDEAHSTGILGNKGEGLVQLLNLEKQCFARIHTFGKAMGCHGAIVLGSETLREYLINFCRPFIYTTAISPAAVAAIDAAYTVVERMTKERERLNTLIKYFRIKAHHLDLTNSATAIQGVLFPGNEKVKSIAEKLRSKDFDVRPILYPTVPLNTERLRVVIHSFNTEEQLTEMIRMIG